MGKLGLIFNNTWYSFFPVLTMRQAKHKIFTIFFFFSNPPAMQPKEDNRDKRLQKNHHLGHYLSQVVW